MKNIVILATLDTKSTEALYLKLLVEKSGYRAVLIDISCRRHKISGADISNYEIAETGGFRISGESGKRDMANKMSDAVSGIVSKLHEEKRLNGIIGIGGSIGAGIASSAMKTLPFGVPKLCVTTIQNTAPLVGWKDIAILYPVTDLSDGKHLNRFEKVVLSNAAGAIIGMMKASKPKIDHSKPLILASMFGSTTPCVTHAKEILEKEGYEVVVFHAQGSGGRALEEFISSENVSGILDVTTHELADEHVGGALSAGPDRLEAAGKAGIPQLVCPGALDIVVFFGFHLVPTKYRHRHFYQHSQHVVNMKTSRKEMSGLAKTMTRKINKARGLTTIVIPMRGWSEYDIENGVTCVDVKGQVLKKSWFDPVSIKVFTKTLEENLDKSNSNLRLVKADAHINDPVFASTIAKEMIRLLET